MLAKENEYIMMGNAWHISEATQTTEDFCVLVSVHGQYLENKSFENPMEFWLPFRNGRVKSIKCSVEIVCPQTYFILTGYILLRTGAMT